MTGTVKRVLRTTGASEIIRRVTPPGRVDILLYHGVCEGSLHDSRFPTLMPLKQFERQVEFLAKRAKPLRLERLAQGQGEGVVLTFDDGYANNFHLAFPVLLKYEFPATVFLATGFVDRAIPLWGNWLQFLLSCAPRRNSCLVWRDERVPLRLRDCESVDALAVEFRHRLRRMAIADIHDFLRALESQLQICYDWDRAPQELHPLTWDQVRAMRRSGLVAFGSHTVSHAVLSRCAADVQASEIAASKKRVESELGEACPAFAYPYGQSGDFTGETRRIAAAVGHTLVLTAEPGFNTPSRSCPVDLKRWGANLGLDELDFIISGGPVLSGYVRRAFGH
jgi:peptidoglycan/xylan/chitin deacetylase (PgdA/CDA1 family)